MNEVNPRQREMMDELNRRFLDSAATMRRIARRIQAAADASREVDSRARDARRRLADEVGAPERGVAFSYLEYLEFSGADEFARFRHEPPVTDADLAAINWDELSRKLLDPS